MLDFLVIMYQVYFFLNEIKKVFLYDEEVCKKFFLNSRYFRQTKNNFNCEILSTKYGVLVLYRLLKCPTPPVLALPYYRFVKNIFMTRLLTVPTSYVACHEVV